MPEQHHVAKKKKTSLINYVIGNQKFSRRNKIYSITLELKHVINYCDVRRGVSVTNPNAKEKRSFAKNSGDILNTFGWRRSDYRI